jgi:hypothetical protein
LNVTSEKTIVTGIKTSVNHKKRFVLMRKTFVIGINEAVIIKTTDANGINE